VRKLLLLVGAVVLVDTMFFAGLTPLLPHLAAAFHLSKSGAGILTGAYAAGAILGAIPGGMVAARVGVKPTILAGLAVMSVTSIAFGVVDHLWALDLARFLQGFASAFSWIGGLTWLVEAAPRERRGEVIGLVMSGAILGALLGPVLGGIASFAGRGPTFSGIAGLGAVLAVAAWTTPAPQAEPVQPLRMLGNALRNRHVVTGLWFSVLPGLLFGVLSVLAPLRLHRLGFGALAIGAIFLVSGLIEATASPVLGRLSDRHGRMRPLLFGLVTSTALSLALPWLDLRWSFPVLVCCTGLAYGVFWTPGMALLADGIEHVGLSYAYGFTLLDLAWAPGNALGSVAGGLLAQATSDAVPYLGGAVLCGITLAVVLRRRELHEPVPATAEW
jgi:MFS family permease